ncbi:unnamed protein product [Calicophoron daubneyi]|uniref:Uncharacterized protein n=1 Tax=Calicophoron daubneyi TaxID=300641 RepID=A0AAV2TDW0_CALDB
MFSLIKAQVIKPFLKFTKNLSADQINISVLKGEGELKSLELDENNMMELLDLPTWLQLRRAYCSNIKFKIHWTKLETHPVFVTIDRVDVDIEALSEPRPEMDSTIASYRAGAGKYRLADKVVDGASILVNTVYISFSAQAFQASFELSRFTSVSKTPKWQDGPLNLTSLSWPHGDALLLFKELSWDSMRIVADGLVTELNGIPVKLITNAGRIRLTLKKRLSDSAMISSRIQFILHDLLWVLTLSQVEAAIVFLRSLKHSVLLSAQQSKQYAASRAKRQTLSWKNSIIQPTTQPSRSSYSRRPLGIHKDEYTAASRIFQRYNVLETSYHVCVHRTEVHFCDENREGTQLNQVVTPNGYIRFCVNGFEVDWYPYHVDVYPQTRWRGCEEFREARDNWLSGLNRLHFPQNRPIIPPANATPSNFSAEPLNSRHSSFSGIEISVIQSVAILRMADVNISQVSFPDSPAAHPGWPLRNAKNVEHTDLCQLREELPSDSNLFIATDKKLHCLSDKTNFLTIELRTSYDANPMTSPNPVPKGEPLPCILFGQFKPFYVRFDADTVIWLNAFLLTLYMNLSILMRQRKPQPDDDFSSDNRQYHVRFEALMPRIILPLHSGRPIPDRNPSLVGPDAFVVQTDLLTIELLVPPLASHTASVLKRLIEGRLSSTKVASENVHGKPHVPVKMEKFSVLANSADSTPVFSEELPQQRSLSDQYWCLHCPHLWAHFLTVAEVVDSGDHSPATNHKGNRFTLYRQSLLEPIPLTVWAAASGEFSTVSKHQPPLDLLIDLDSSVDPLKKPLRSSRSQDTHKEPRPLRLCLGDIPALNAGLRWSALSADRLPDAMDQVILLGTLSTQISRVKDQLTVDMYQIAEMVGYTNLESNTTERWVYSLIFNLCRPIEIRLIPIGFKGFLSENTPLPQVKLRRTTMSRRSNRTSRHKSGEGDLAASHHSDSRPSGLCPQPHENDITTSDSYELKLTRPAEHVLSGSDPNLTIIANGNQNSKSPLLHSTIVFQERNESKPYSLTNLLDPTTSVCGGQTNSLSVCGDSALENLNIAGSRDDWIKPYEGLMEQDGSTTITSDDVSILSFDSFGQSSSSSSLPLAPEEIGAEVSENGSLHISPLAQTPDLPVDNDANAATSPLKSEQSDPLIPEHHTISALILRLTRVMGEADSTDVDMRFWIDLGDIDFSLLDDAQRLVPLKLSHSDLSHPNLWSIFTSIVRSCTPPESTGAQLCWMSELYFQATLSSSWSLAIPRSVRTICSDFLYQFARRGGLGQFEFLADMPNGLKQTVPSSFTPMFCLHLSGGSLELNLNSDSCVDSDSPPVRKILLQKGMFVSLNKDGHLSLEHRLLPSVITSPEICCDSAPTNADEEDLNAICLGTLPQLDASKSETDRLVDRIQVLRSNIDRLNAELEKTQLLLQSSVMSLQSNRSKQFINPRLLM